MLNSEEFIVLSQHLNIISHIVPYKSGGMAAIELDRKLPKLFEYKTYDELSEAIERNILRGFIPNTDHARNHFKHRWFVYKCSEVDEYLFTTIVSGRFGLELKGAVILKEYGTIARALDIPLALIDWSYKQQSRDFHYRGRLKNRLFFVPYSYMTPAREPVLRVNFDAKEFVFKEYAKLLANPEHKIFEYMNGRKADIIFLIENLDGSLSYGIGSRNIKDKVKLKPIKL